MNNIKDIITSNINGATFISVDTCTIQKLTGGKKNPFQQRVQKVTEQASVMIFQNKTTNGYENMVNRRLKEEGKNPKSFKLSERKWGSRIPNMPFVEHKGEYYFEVIFLKPGKSHYEVDGQLTEKDNIEGLPVKRDYGGQGGLDNEVIIRTFNIKSITKININKKSFNGPFNFK